MPLLRVIPALLSLVVAALFLSRAMKRLVGVVALLVGSAIAFAAGGILMGSIVWSFVRRWRGHGTSAEG